MKRNFMNSHRNDPAASRNASHDTLRSQNERRTLVVVLVTLVTMVAEIVAGFLTGSMALLSDGWHMGTHAGALGIALFAYIYSRKHAEDKRYTFGTGKVGVLAAYTSAIILGITGLLIFYESIRRLFDPVSIDFGPAILVAVIGLCVNLFCALILGNQGHHHHSDDAARLQDHETDQNYRAAFLHVLADALTSVLAIFALLMGRYYDLLWPDAVAGLLGGVLILIWARQLLRQTSHILLDGVVEQEMTEKIRKIMENEPGCQVQELKIWRIGENDFAAMVVMKTTISNQDPEHFKSQFYRYEDMKFVNIEIH